MVTTDNTCGIILAGGTGSRLFPLTLAIAKSLLPVYKQPMVYYPIKTLLSMGIRDILIIVASEQQKALFKAQLGNGERFKVNLTYTVQEKPNGLAEAFIIGKDFIGERDVVLVLGDNVIIPYDTDIYYRKNTIWTYNVKNPGAYGVVKLDDYGDIETIVEKPLDFVSDMAVIGLYAFCNDVVNVAPTLTPSFRGELEIVDLIKAMMSRGHPLAVQPLAGLWFDCGTPDDLLECSEMIRSLTKRTALDILLA